MSQFNQEQFSESVSAFIRDELLFGRAVDADEDLLLSGLVDSIGVMGLVSKVEELLGDAVPPADVVIENFTSVAAITSYASSRVER